MIRAEKVAGGLERFAALTPTLPPATHTNSYALGTREVVLVEPATPYENERREWLAWARGIESSGRRLVAIVATHHHADHVGGATFFSEELGVPLWAHARTAELLGRELGRSLVDREQLVLDGPEPMTLEVLHTPGHASDHVCLYERASKTVIVGDMVASEGTILIAPGDGDMAEYVRQLSRLEKLEATTALPAHGDPIGNPSRLFRAYQAHRAMREGWVLRSVQQTGGGTLDELVAVAYADTKPEIHPIAKLSLEAHLIKLEQEGSVRREGERWLANEGV